MIDNPEKIITDTTQMYSCSGCDDFCCRSFSITLDKNLKETLEKTDIIKKRLNKNNSGFEKANDNEYFLPITKDKSCNQCIFNDPKQRCIIHSKLGVNLKPITCRVFPFCTYFDEQEQVHLEYSFRCKSIRDNYGEVIHKSRLKIANSCLNMEYFPKEYPLYNKVLSQSEIFKTGEILKNILSNENIPLENCVFTCYKIVSILKKRIKSGKKFSTVLDEISRINPVEKLPKPGFKLLSKTVLASFLAKTLIYGSFSRNNPLFTDASIYISEYLKLYIGFAKLSSSLDIPSIGNNIDLTKLQSLNNSPDERSNNLIRRYLKALLLRGKPLKELNKDLEFFNRTVYHYTLIRVISGLVAINDNSNIIKYKHVSSAIATIELALYHCNGDILYLNEIENKIIRILRGNLENESSISSLLMNELCLKR